MNRAPTSLRKPVILQHPGDGLGQGGAEGGGDGLLGVYGTMEVAELTLGVGVATGGFEPALEHRGGTRPLRPVAVGPISGLDECAQGASGEEAFDRGGIFRADGRDELLAFARFHGQVL